MLGRQPLEDVPAAPATSPGLGAQCTVSTVHTFAWCNVGTVHASDCCTQASVLQSAQVVRRLCGRQHHRVIFDAHGGRFVHTGDGPCGAHHLPPAEELTR